MLDLRNRNVVIGIAVAVVALIALATYVSQTDTDGVAPEPSTTQQPK
jgi:hypothetical protein